MPRPHRPARGAPSQAPTRTEQARQHAPQPAHGHLQHGYLETICNLAASIASALSHARSLVATTASFAIAGVIGQAIGSGIEALNMPARALEQAAPTSSAPTSSAPSPPARAAPPTTLTARVARLTQRPEPATAMEPNGDMIRTVELLAKEIADLKALNARLQALSVEPCEAPPPRRPAQNVASAPRRMADGRQEERESIEAMVDKLLTEALGADSKRKRTIGSSGSGSVEAPPRFAPALAPRHRAQTPKPMTMAKALRRGRDASPKPPSHGDAGATLNAHAMARIQRADGIGRLDSALGQALE